MTILIIIIIIIDTFIKRHKCLGYRGAGLGYRGDLHNYSAIIWAKTN